MEGECPDQVCSRRNSEEISGSCVCGPLRGKGSLICAVNRPAGQEATSRCCSDARPCE